jgi:hypothetical protein
VAEQNPRAAVSRLRPPVHSITLWTVICAALVVAVHFSSVARGGFHLGSYASGVATLAAFALAATYSLRKRTLWASLRLLQIAAWLPSSIARRLVYADRLETWRFTHVAIGIFVVLPLWWHIEAGFRAGTIEVALAVLLALLVLSGIAGAVIQEFLPHVMRLEPDHEVRLQDVEEAIVSIYHEAEEAILGHSEKLVAAYLETIRPILRGAEPRRMLLRATLTAADPSVRRCTPLRARAAELGAEAQLFQSLVDLAARKIRLEQNRFNLTFGIAWMRLHVALMLLTGFAIGFHVLGTLYLDGL